MALARRRIKSCGDVKALKLIPITKPVFDQYRAMLEREYPTSSSSGPEAGDQGVGARLPRLGSRSASRPSARRALQRLGNRCERLRSGLELR